MNLLEKLKRKAYRNAYVAEHVRRGIAYQIRALRDQRGWNQGKLASLMDKPQSVVSRVEDPSYGKVTVQTLLEVAATFDVALQIRFVSYSTFLQQTRDLSSGSMRVESFADDASLKAPIRERGSMLVIETFRTDNVKISSDLESQLFGTLHGSSSGSGVSVHVH